MRRRELPREAFLGEMVVGHKSNKVKKKKKKKKKKNVC